MKLENLAIPTLTIQPGDRVDKLLRECVEKDVPGLPVVDESGAIAGRLCIRNVLRQTCVPPYLIQGAHVLGDELELIRMPHVQVREILDLPATDFIEADYAWASSHSMLLKGLARMERFNSNYIFLVDDGEYKGIVTYMAIARRMLEHVAEEL